MVPTTQLHQGEYRVTTKLIEAEKDIMAQHIISGTSNTHNHSAGSRQDVVLKLGVCDSPLWETLAVSWNVNSSNCHEVPYSRMQNTKR